MCTDTVPSNGILTLFQEVVEKNLRLTQGTTMMMMMMKKREDAESVGNDSSMSTSSNLEPFANDDLGTVTVCMGKLFPGRLKLVKLFI